MCSFARDARWGPQLIALDTTLPWDVLGALPETFVTAAGSLEHLGLKAGETLLLRGATSSVGLACLELARAAGVRVIATTRSEAKSRRLIELGAAGAVLEGGGFTERAQGSLPGGADGAVDLIGGPSVLETLRLLRPAPRPATPARCPTPGCSRTSSRSR